MLTPLLLGCDGLHCMFSDLLHGQKLTHLIYPCKISVNASILSDSGGTCVCEAANNCATDPTYLQCVQEVKQDLITSTAAMSALASVLMGALANLPVGMAPGMGLNAYVRLSCSYLGTLIDLAFTC
jgi:xanthine/uracil/vitamin C permease (AzgA family)